MDRFVILEDVASAAVSDDLRRIPSQVDGVLGLANAPELTLVILEEDKGQNSSVVSKTLSQKCSTEVHLVDQETNSPSFSSAENELTQNFESDSLEGAENNEITDQSVYFATESDHAEVWHDDPSIHKQRISFSVVSLELFKFSRQYEQLKDEMNSSEKTFEEALTCETSRKTSVECYKKLQYEKERLEELVEKMLLNCEIQGFCEQGVVDSGNDSLVLGSCSKGTANSRKCQCRGTITLREDEKEFNARVALASQKEVCVQTENNLPDCSQPDYLEKDKVAIALVSQKEVCVQTENNLPDCSQENYLEKDKTGSKTSQNAARLARDLEDLQQKHKQITQELQGKIFEVESELCSVEIERDLNNETARYLEEQVASVSSGLSMRENELVSFRKRYKFLNEALLSSEELRERLESETSRMSAVVKELEERLEKDGEVSSDIFSKDPTDSEGDHFDFTKEVERLEGEISEVNTVLEKEKVQRNGVEEMLDNVEKERELLLTELDELKNAYQLQRVELEEYKEKRHNASKKELQEKEPRQDQQQVCEENNEEILELQGNIAQLSRRILFLEDVNQKLEREVYQQLEVMEKMKTENTASRQELESIGSELKKVKLEEELVTDYYALKSENKTRQMNSQDVKPPAIELDPELCSTSKVKETSCCCKLYSVPRSEYVKLKFQLKSMSDEMRLLKEVTVPEAMKNLSVAAKTMAHERTSLKNETNVVNKWLNTMKESVGVVMEKDEVISKRFDSVLFETQLHDARINLSELQHEIEMIKKDKEILLSQNGNQEKALNVLKQRIVEDQIRYENTLKELKEKSERLKKELKDEKKNHIKAKARVVSLEERNTEIGFEFENVKRKLECLERGKKMVEEELKKIKLDVLKFFGGEALESVYESWSDTRKKCSEYVKVIENNKNIIFKCQRDFDTLTNVNTALRKEVNEAKVEKEEKSESQKCSGDMSPGADQIQTSMQSLETRKNNEHELLGVYMQGKKKRDESEEQMNIVRNELQKVKVLLSQKECEFETSKVIIQELEATCQVYDNEFEKMTNTHDKNGVASTHAYRSLFSSDLTMNETTLLEESVVPRDENESTADNVRELHEMVQESLATKLQVLQRHFGELTEALCACRELNITLRQRLHSVEMKYLENEGKNVHRKMDEELEKVLKEISERERSMEEMLCKPCPECNSDWGAVVQSANYEHLKDTLLHCKEVITRLRTDNETYEEDLFEAHERIKEHEQKIAMIDYYTREKNTTSTDNDVEDIRDMKEHSCHDEYAEMETESHGHRYRECVILEDENTSLDYSAEQVTDGTTRFSSRGVEASSKNLKEELDCITAKYVNMRAAFEGCQRRLRFLESETQVGAGVMNDEAVVMATYTPPVSFPGNDRNPSQKHSWTQTVHSELQSSFSLFSEISVNFSETSDDAGFGTERDHIVVELTLRETEMDGLESQRNVEEMDEGRFENDYLRLRNKIQELESIVLFSKNELQRVKVCSFEEMLNFENTLKNMKDGNTLLTTKLGGLEQENGELRFRVEELEAKLLACDQETQRIQICSFTEKQVFDNTIEDLQETNHTMTKRIEELEQEKRNLDVKIEEVVARVLGCYNETQRVKVCSFNERQTFYDTVKTLQNTLSIREKDVDEHKKNGQAVFKMRALEDQVSVCNEEIQRIKVCSFNERKNLENKIKNLQDIKTRRVPEDRKKEKDELETRMKEHEAKISDRDEEIQRIKVCSFSEIQNLEDTVKNLKDTIVTTEKQVEDTTKEKAQMESIIKEHEAKISSHDEKIKRITVCSFNEIQNLEETVKDLKDSIVTTEKQVEEKTKEKAQMELRMKEHEDKISSRDEEIKRIKVCAFSERENLKDTIKTAEAMKTMRIADLKKETDDLETRIKQHEAKILSFGGEIKRIKVCAFNERKNLDGTIKNLQNAIATTAKRVQESRQTEKDEIQKNNGEKRSLQEAFDGVREECDILKEKIRSYEQETSVLRINVANLEDEKLNLESSMRKSNEKLHINETEKSNLRENIKKYRVEIEGWKENLRNRKEDEDLKRLMTEMDEKKQKEIKNLRETIEKCNEEIRVWKQRVHFHEDEVIILGNKLEQIEHEKEDLERLMTEMDEQKQNEIKNLAEVNEKCNNEIDSWKLKLHGCQDNVIILRTNLEELENEKWRNEEKEKEKQFLETYIESSRKTLIVLNADIEEVSAKKVGLEKQLRDLNLTVEKEELSWRKKKENYQQDILNLREIMDELMKSKLTLLEEISQLSDEKKEGQEKMNNEITQLRKLCSERRNQYEEIKREKSKLELQISSLKITLDTLQSAYEQSQDDNKLNEKRFQELRGEAIKNEDKQKLVNDNGRLKNQITALEKKLSQNSETKNKELFSLKGTESRLFELEKEKETYKNENVVLMERLKQLELPNEENSRSGTSSTQVNNLRKKLKEFRSKLGEEKKQREVCEFEIKNLKEKVERLTKKENEVGEKLDANRKKFLEIKTEKDALRLDLEGVHKKTKREVEGYTSRIESLVNEVKSFKEKEMNKEDGKQLKKTLGIVNEQNKLLEMKLAANAERSSKENQDLQNSLKLLRGRYESEQERFKNMETTNQSDILELKKVLSTIERECEKKAKELDKLRENLSMINKDKERIEKLLIEKTSEGKKWKKEAFDAKAEISFLRGALNILEKEGVTKKIPATDDLVTSA